MDTTHHRHISSSQLFWKSFARQDLEAAECRCKPSGIFSISTHWCKLFREGMYIFQPVRIRSRYQYCLCFFTYSSFMIKYVSHLDSKSKAWVHNGTTIKRSGSQLWMASYGEIPCSARVGTRFLIQVVRQAGPFSRTETAVNNLPPRPPPLVTRQ